ncbi:hypothetical protein BCR44DRAFT_1427837, partial [Catenaria anguillulae PL171]
MRPVMLVANEGQLVGMPLMSVMIASDVCPNVAVAAVGGTAAWRWRRWWCRRR